MYATICNDVLLVVILTSDVYVHKSSVFVHFRTQVLFGVACPAAVGAAATALSAGTSGAGTAIVAAGAVAGKHACHVRRRRCKREVRPMVSPTFMACLYPSATVPPS